jgi:hypothetical protein
LEQPVKYRLVYNNVTRQWGIEKQSRVTGHWDTFYGPYSSQEEAREVYYALKESNAITDGWRIVEGLK